MSSTRQRLSRAFTLIELLLVVAIIALLISILLPALKNARKISKTTMCMSNMRQLHLGHYAYAADYANAMATFNRTPTTLPEAGKQAQEIVLRQTGQTLPLIQNRYFHRNYWHLVLVDGGYFGNTTSAITSPVAACPEDAVVLRWKKAAIQPGALLEGMESDGLPGYEKYRPFWSSFQLSPASWSQDKKVGTATNVNQSTSAHHLFTNHTVPLGKRKIDDVSFPSQKVFIFDLYDRHVAKNMTWYAYPFVRQPLAFFDNSVRVMKTSDSQRGYKANSLTPVEENYTYNPTGPNAWRLYDPPIPAGYSGTVNGYYRWTRNGLRGYDFSGAKSFSGN